MPAEAVLQHISTVSGVLAAVEPQTSERETDNWLLSIWAAV